MIELRCQSKACRLLVQQYRRTQLVGHNSPNLFVARTVYRFYTKTEKPAFPFIRLQLYAALVRSHARVLAADI